MPPVSKLTQPSNFLGAFPVPDDTGQRALTLACAGARVLHRVSLLRSPRLPPPLRVALDALDTESVPISAHRLVPLAHALCKKDPGGTSTDASIDWLRTQATEDPDLRRIIDAAMRSRRRWRNARAAVVRANLRLGSSIVHRLYMRTGVPFEDLFQESILGLIVAADRFDPNYGVKFSTYATWWVRHAVQRSLQNTMRLVRLPAKICDQLSRFNVAVHKLGEHASDEAIATRSSLAEKDVRKIRSLRSTRAAYPISLDQTLPGTRDLHMIDQVRSDLPDLDHRIDLYERVEDLEILLDSLPPRSRNILEQRFGLDDDDEKTLASIARQIGLSRERVRQIQDLALGDLRARAARTQCPISQL